MELSTGSTGQIYVQNSGHGQLGHRAAGDHEGSNELAVQRFKEHKGFDDVESKMANANVDAKTKALLQQNKASQSGETPLIMKQMKEEPARAKAFAELRFPKEEEIGAAEKQIAEKTAELADTSSGALSRVRG